MVRSTDYKEFASILMTAANLYNVSNISDRFDTYFNLLLPYDIDYIKGAVLEHMGTEKWFPTVSELINKIIGYRESTINDYWIKFLQLKSNLTEYIHTEAIIPDGAIAKVINDFLKLSLPIKQMSFHRDSFNSLYRDECFNGLNKKAGILSFPESEGFIQFNIPVKKIDLPLWWSDEQIKAHVHEIEYFMPESVLLVGIPRVANITHVETPRLKESTENNSEMNEPLPLLKALTDEMRIR
jgi:hypothetical protein